MSRSSTYDLQELHDEFFRRALCINDPKNRFAFLRESILICERYWNEADRGRLVKKLVTTFLKEYNARPAFRTDVRMLDMWRLLGKYSQEYGMAGVLEKVDETGYFREAVPFYELWAAHFSLEGRWEDMERVIEKCRERCPLVNGELEARFGHLRPGPEQPEFEQPSLHIPADESMVMLNRVVVGRTLPLVATARRNYSSPSSPQCAQEPPAEAPIARTDAPPPEEQMQVDEGVEEQPWPELTPPPRNEQPQEKKSTTPEIAPPTPEEHKEKEQSAAPQAAVLPHPPPYEEQYSFEVDAQKENSTDELDPFASPAVKKPKSRVTGAPPPVLAARIRQEPPQEKASPQLRSPQVCFLNDNDPTLAGAHGKPATQGDGKTSTPNKMNRPAFELEDTEQPPRRMGFEEEAPESGSLDDDFLCMEEARDKPTELFTFGASQPPTEGALSRRLSMNKNAMDQMLGPKAAAKPTIAAVKPPTKTTTTADIENLMRDIDLGTSTTNTESEGAESEPNAADLLETTGLGNVIEVIKGDVNPWDENVRRDIMDRGHTNCNKHDMSETCQKLDVRKKIDLGGEKFEILALLGQGGFAKVFRAVSEEDHKQYAIKYQIPPCPWEAYVCNELQRRVRSEVRDWLMSFRDAFIFTNASVIVYDFFPHGTLLDLSNRYKQSQMEMDGTMLAILGTHIAMILEAVHGARIIHADVKPDNFVVVGPIPTHTNWQEVTARPVLKLIDWGRAIDMRYQEGRVFVGRAGTQCFDCIEMLNDQPWTYQTDYYGFCATVYVLMFNEYLKTVVDVARKKNVPLKPIKKRIVLQTMWQDLFEQFLNIESCDKQPEWHKITVFMREQLKYVWRLDQHAWRQGLERFNAVLAKQK